MPGCRWPVWCASSISTPSRRWASAMARRRSSPTIEDDAMPVKLRIAKARRAQFSAETVTLFLRLENTLRHSEAFRAGERQLARQLELLDQYWTGNSVCDRSLRPPWPKALIAYDDWHACRAVRLE